MPQNFYELTWIFIIYAFIGWCTEVSYAALDRGIFVNRGFLNGPYCPIYGFGVVIVVNILTPLQNNVFLLFLGSIILTTMLEFLTGFLLEKIFHNKWWDYSDKPFNIKGYVCLKFSIYWGLSCTFIMEIIHPAIYKGITLIPKILGVVLLGIFMIILTFDVCATVGTILKLNKKLKLMEELAHKIHKLSDEIGESIFENVSDAIEKSEEFQETHAQLMDKLTEKKADLLDMPESAKKRLSVHKKEKQKELDELSAKYRDLIEEKSLPLRRLLKAFPNITSRDNDKILQDMKKHFHIIRTHEKKKEKPHD